MSAPDGNSSSTGTVLVPAGTAEGVTTLRVRGVYSTSHDNPCGSAFGEVEDYTLNVKCGTSCSLPVSWGDFTAVALGKNSALLNWSTEVEEDLDRFIVERSVDGRAFIAIGELAATNAATAYSFIDDAAPASLAYYRILARDFDGGEDYSLVRRVTWRTDDERAVKMFPNPVGGTALTVNWVSPEAERVNWHVYNTYGQEVRKGLVGAAAGANTVELAIDELPAGVYLLRLRTRDWDWTGSLVRR